MSASGKERPSAHLTELRCRFCGREGRYYRDEPTGYLQWQAWAEAMVKTHHQEPCPDCGRFTVWRKGAAPDEGGE